jgi:hypothetical protein
MSIDNYPNDILGIDRGKYAGGTPIKTGSKPFRDARS